MVAKNEPQSVKQCRVMTAGLTRYQKEYNSYVKEVDQMNNKLNAAKEGGCPHEIKKWVYFVLLKNQDWLI